MKKKTTKGDKKLIDKIYKLVMEQTFPERTSVLLGFDEKGKEIELARIVYKKGGFDIKERKISNIWKNHLKELYAKPKK